MKIHPKFLRIPTLMAVTTLLLMPSVSALGFTDNAAITNTEAVEVLSSRGIISGKPDGRFDPNGMTLRSEMAAMISLLLDPNADYPAPSFTDTADSWAKGYIGHCTALGILSGRGDGSFAPNIAVTGTETARMILSAGGYDSTAFTGPDWAQRIDTAAREAGLYQGFTASPSAPLTRDHAALLLYNGFRAGLIGIGVLDLDASPSSIAALPDDSMLLTDTYGRRLHKLTDGKLSDYAGKITALDVGGQNVGGCIDGAAADSAFRQPWAAVPFLGGFAVSDTENNLLRLVKDGSVQTINATLPGEDFSTHRITEFDTPTGLAAGEDGCLYVSETQKGTVRRISAEGELSTIIEGLNAPMGLCWQNGVLYIAEAGANRILMLENGQTRVLAGSGEDGYADGAAASASFSVPQCVAAAADGTVYVSDTGNSAVRMIRNGNVSTLLHREPGSEAAYPVSPQGLLLQGRTLYICDSFANKLLSLTVS